jgi:hypothetical protein
MRYKKRKEHEVHSGILKCYSVLFGNATKISHGRFCDRFWLLCLCRVLIGAQCHKHMQAEVTVRPSLMLRSRYI